MRLTTLKTIFVLIALSTSYASAQEPQNWKTFWHAAGADTSMSCLDSAGLSRQAYLIAYGLRDSRIPWSIAEHIDSAKVNEIVQNVLSGEADGIAAMKSLEPTFQPYQELRKLVDSLLETKMDSLIDWHLLRYTLNEYRLLNRAAGQMIIQVNVPSATLRVLDRSGDILLECPVIVGSPSRPTPVFGAYLTGIITYPYWNVPRSIATKEFLPKIKRNPSRFLSDMKLQVLNSKGIVIDAENIDWKNLSAKNFPYRLRQSTGCDNALGLIKFDIDSPYDVYLHDTNHRELFGKEYRFLSHGCIRVAQPVKLANLLMHRDFLPETFTDDRFYNIRSRVFALPSPVPVLITYALVEAEPDSALHQYKDIYKRIKAIHP